MRRERRALAGIRILVVDDDPDIGEVLQLVLEAQGAVVCIALSAAEALESLGRFRPDVLLSDLAMPGCSGYELMRSIVAREGDNAPPAAALSAYPLAREQVEALASGFRMLLEKPIKASALMEAVVALAGTSRDAAVRRRVEGGHVD